jgi:anti-sigma regulatory factor (Ser/Thr protein kinase)
MADALDKASAHRRFAARFPAVPEAIGAIRGEMAAIADECGLDESGAANVKLAVSEAATNVVMHAYQDEPGEITAQAYYSDGELMITIADEGSGMKPRVSSPGLGLGLPVIATAASRFEVISKENGTEIQMVFPCPKGVR